MANAEYQYKAPNAEQQRLIELFDEHAVLSIKRRANSSSDPAELFCTLCLSPWSSDHQGGQKHQSNLRNHWNGYEDYVVTRVDRLRWIFEGQWGPCGKDAKVYEPDCARACKKICRHHPDWIRALRAYEHPSASTVSSDDFQMCDSGHSAPSGPAACSAADAAALMDAIQTMTTHVEKIADSVSLLDQRLVVLENVVGGWGDTNDKNGKGAKHGGKDKGKDGGKDKGKDGQGKTWANV